MNSKILVFIAALLAGNSYAILIPLTAQRTVSISGSATSVAGTDSYSQTQSSTELGAFASDLSHSAESLGFSAQSQASQTSTISPSEILIDLALYAATQMPFSQPPGGVTARASSLFEFTFQTLEPLSYELGGTFFRASHDFPGPNFTLALLGSLGTVFEDQSVLPRMGFLLPDTYTFRVITNLAPWMDPLGDLQVVESRISLRTTSVPETGSTLLFLGGAFGLLLISRKSMKKASGHLHFPDLHGSLLAERSSRRCGPC